MIYVAWAVVAVSLGCMATLVVMLIRALVSELHRSQARVDLLLDRLEGQIVTGVPVALPEREAWVDGAEISASRPVRDFTGLVTDEVLDGE